MNKITFTDKVDTQINPDPEINKVTASTLNEIKTIVNETVDQVEVNLSDIGQTVRITGDQSIAGIKTFTDNVIAITQANATNDTTVATTAFVKNLIGEIPAGLSFEGTWDADTNTPDLSTTTPNNGQFWIVSVSGATDLGGITDWKVGDWAIYVTDGAGADGWQKVDNSSVLDGQGTGQTVALWSGSGDTNTLTNSPITVSGDDVTFAGDINLLDNEKAIFGTGSNLQIYRDANDSRIVDEDSIIIKSQHIAFQAGTSTETIAHFYGDSSVELYYDGVKKFSTTSAGIGVTGGGSFTGLVTMTDRLDLNDALYNVFTGGNSGFNNTIGGNNSSLGLKSLFSNTEGSNNVASGFQSLYFNTTGDHNIAYGYQGLYFNTTGNYNIGVGYVAGGFITDGTTENETGSNSIFIGKDTRANADGQTNQIVIGDTAIGNGSNTVTLGNDSIATTYLKGDVNITGTITGVGGEFLPLAGGTLTGALSGTSATFAGNVLLNGYLSVEGTTGNTGVATDRWIGGDGTSGTWFYNVPTDSSHLFAINNSNVLTLSGTSATFAGNVTAQGATFTDDVTIDNSSPELYLTPDASKYSWMIAAQENVDQHFEITPSTTVGGTTFSTPALKISGVNSNATFAGDVTTNGDITIDNASGDPFLKFKTTAQEYVIRIDQSDSEKLQIRDTTNNATRLTIDSSGNVGIGTASPKGNLQVSGSNAIIVLQDNAGAVDKKYRYFQNNDNKLFFARANDAFNSFSTDMVIDNTGNVGIGTDSPSVKLHVSENASTYIKVERTTSSSEGSLVLGAETNENTIFSRGLGSANKDLRVIIGATERMRITSAGNVGIGTDSPSAKLHVNGGDIIIQNVDPLSPYASSGKLRFLGRYDRYLGGINTVNTGGNTEYDNGLDFYVQRATFNTAGHFAMRINHLGNVGIGTDSPSAKLEIIDTSNPDGTSGSLIIEGRRDGSANLLTLRARDASAPTSALPNGQGGLFRFQGFDGTDFENMGYIQVAADGQAVANADAPSFMAFGTSADGSSSPIERMRITSGGDVLIGTDTASASVHTIAGSQSNGGQSVLKVYNSSSVDNSPAITATKNSATTSSSARFIQFYSNDGAQPMGGIVGNGAENAQFLTLSDEREKENIIEISGSLDKIMKLKVSEFDWKKTGEHIKAGFIAQDVEAVFPEYVVENAANEEQEPRKGITGGMSAGYIAHLTKAIQELKAEIDILKAK